MVNEAILEDKLVDLLPDCCLYDVSSQNFKNRDMRDRRRNGRNCGKVGRERYVLSVRRPLEPRLRERQKARIELLPSAFQPFVQ